MTEQEAEAHFSEIQHALIELGLEWLATEVAAEIAEGKIQSKILSVRSEFESDEEGDVELVVSRSIDVDPRPRRKAEFSHVIPFTAKEKLALLIKAI